MECNETNTAISDRDSVTIDNPLKVLLADANEIIRAGLISYLTKTGFRVVAECPSSEELVGQIKKQRPDVVLMDMHLPGSCGVDLCLSISGSTKGVKVIILSECDDSIYIFSAMCAGAHGYFLKSDPLDDLAVAIKSVAGGERRFFSKESSPIMAKAVPWICMHSGVNPIKGILSPRKIEVLALVAEGKTNKQIAGVLSISEKTVKNYLSEIFIKLKVRRRSEAAAIYSRTEFQGSIWKAR